MLFSIIIPVFNAEKYLAEALDSVLAQTFADWECVCIDDGSTDGSAVILDDYARRDNRFNVVHKPNGGVSSARNAGLDAAHGEYITWLDADDVLAPTRFEVACKIITRENPDYVALSYVSGVECPSGFGANMGDDQCEVCVGAEAYDRAWMKLHMHGMLWLSFAKKTIYDNVRCIEGLRIKEDSLLTSRLYPRINKLCIGKDAGYFYRVSTSSAMHGCRHAEDCVTVMQMYLALWNEQRDYATKIKKLDVLKWRIQRGCGTNVIDWILGRPKSEDKSASASVYKAYCEVANSGAFTNQYVQDKRFWPWFCLYECYGYVAPIVVAYKLFAFGGKVLRFLRLKGGGCEKHH